MRHPRVWLAAAAVAVDSVRRIRAGAAPADDGLLTDFVWRSLGPGSAAGRIVDVESLDADPRFLLVASASGGVWKSVNGGTTFTPDLRPLRDRVDW